MYQHAILQRRVPTQIFQHAILFCSGESGIELDEDDGSYFIDRDGRQFHFILDYLRAPDEFRVPQDALVVKELLKEIDYYRVVSRVVGAWVRVPVVCNSQCAWCCGACGACGDSTTPSAMRDLL